ncbi:MAG: hypothetical protein CM15mP88_1380 [Pseudomonadota bacterium]|nr:MAG: hypothetical protein CM15mP88_1380 [Pseudomonadota bacterium]
MNFAEKGDFKSIEKFIKYFQDALNILNIQNFLLSQHLLGLTLGGG